MSQPLAFLHLLGHLLIIKTIPCEPRTLPQSLNSTNTNTKQHSITMKNTNNGQVIGIPIAYSSSYPSSHIKKSRKDSVMSWMNKFSKSIRDHVALGGVERAFKQNFSVGKREKLVKAMQCYLSTTSGPISGMLFISTDKIAFHSDRSITITSPTGNLVKVPYKVLIPLNRIKRVNPSQNSEKPSQKYVQVVTVDDFEFWFMGFVSYQKSLKQLRVQDLMDL